MDSVQGVESAIAKGQQAEDLMKHPVMVEAIERTRQKYYSLFCATNLMEEGARRALYAQRKALDDLLITLTGMVNVAHLERQIKNTQQQ